MSKNKACINIAKEILKKKGNLHPKKIERKLLQRDGKSTGKVFLFVYFRLVIKSSRFKELEMGITELSLVLCS